MVSARLRERTRNLQEMLGQLGRHAWISVQHLTQNLAPGEFRSPYRFPYGLERDVPRTFTMDDDVAILHTGTVPPSMVVRSLAEAILREDMRANQAVHHGDATFAVVIDLSRSILQGCFAGDELTGLMQAATTKLQALFVTVATYLKLAETSGFSVKVIYVHGTGVEEHRAASARSFAERVLFSMSERLVATHARSEEDPASREPFLLGSALSLATTYRHRGIVVVASDFLDPLPSYIGVLGQVAARHRVLLLDLASGEDLDHPRPGWLDVEARRTPVREGARHLELGTEAAPLEKRTIEVWNRQRLLDRRALRGLAMHYASELVPSCHTSYSRTVTEAMRVFSYLPAK